MTQRDTITWIRLTRISRVFSNWFTWLVSSSQFTEFVLQQQRTPIPCAQTYFRSIITYYYFIYIDILRLLEYAVLSQWMMPEEMQKSAFAHNCCVNSPVNNEIKYAIIRGTKFISYALEFVRPTKTGSRWGCEVRCTALRPHTPAGYGGWISFIWQIDATDSRSNRVRV